MGNDQGITSIEVRGEPECSPARFILGTESAASPQQRSCNFLVTISGNCHRIVTKICQNFAAKPTLYRVVAAFSERSFDTAQWNSTERLAASKPASLLDNPHVESCLPTGDQAPPIALDRSGPAIFFAETFIHSHVGNSQNQPSKNTCRFLF